MTAPTQLAGVPLTRAGVSLATGVAGDASNGNYVPNNGHTVLVARNTGGSAYTITFAFPHLVDGQVVPARSVSLAASAVEAFGPFPTDLYGDQLKVTVQNAAVTLIPLTQ